MNAFYATIPALAYMVIVLFFIFWGLGFVFLRIKDRRKMRIERIREKAYTEIQ